MKTIYIRDDDTSYFTPPEKLERLYSRLWAADIPINLAVVPFPRGDVRVLNRTGPPYDPSIPPYYRGHRYSFPLDKNSDICNFLTEKVAQNLVEVCQHGYTHAYHEFDNPKRTEVEQMAGLGQSILARALPEIEIKTFIAPYDRLSNTAFDYVVEQGFHICTNTRSLNGTAYEGSGAYTQHTLPTGRNLVVGDEYIFSHHHVPADCLKMALHALEENDVLVLTNHYWAFFYDWLPIWEDMLAAWDQFVDQLLALDDVQFKTFSAD